MNMNATHHFAWPAAQERRQSPRQSSFISKYSAQRAARLCLPLVLLQLVAIRAQCDETGFVQVPIPWVIVNGSPIAESDNPNTLLITRTRLANFFMNRARISLIPSVRAGGSPFFPVIADPNHPSSGEAANGAEIGDIAVDFSGLIDSHEVRQVRREAKRALGVPPIPFPVPFMARHGMIGIAAGRFNRDNGTPKDIIGWGSRVRDIIIVEDPRRSSLIRPPLPVDDPLPLSVLDLDAVLLSHETGHVLRLDHRMASDAIMNPVIGSWAPGEIPDFGPSERSTMRNAAFNMHGARVDPPGVFEPGPVTAVEVLDSLAGDENPNPIPEHLDLDGAVIRFNQEANTVAFEQDLWGLIPHANLPAPLNCWTLVDLDNNTTTGASGALLAQFGLNTAFEGADLAMRAAVSSNGNQLTTSGQAWEFVGNEVFDVPANGASFSVQRDIFEPMYAAGTTPPNVAEHMEMNDIVIAQVSNAALHTPFALGAPVRVQLILEEAGANPRIWDRLDEQDQGATLVFENPQYPDAFVVDEQGQPIAGRFVPGGLVSATAEGLLPNSPYEVYVGEQLAAAATTGPNGDASIAFPLEPDAPLGFHTLMFVNTGTAIAAGNILEIVAPPAGDYNRNGVVEVGDFVVWRKLLGQPNAPLVADGNGNGQIDEGDYDVWRTNFGRSVTGPQPEPPTGAAVPESSSTVLLLAAALFMALRRRVAASTTGRAATYSP
jgi:hypothetical protein